MAHPEDPPRPSPEAVPGPASATPFRENPYRDALATLGVAFLAVVLGDLAFAATDGTQLRCDLRRGWSAATGHCRRRPELGRAHSRGRARGLLLYGVLAAIALAGRALPAPPLAPLTAVAAAGALFVFAFPEIAAWPGDRITLNRATLQFAPVALLFAVTAFQAFSTRWSQGAPGSQRG